MTPYEQTLGESGKEELPFIRRKPLAEPGSHLPQQIGVKGWEKGLADPKWF